MTEYILNKFGPLKGLLLNRDGQLVFRKEIEYERHHMHLYKAWGISTDIIEFLKKHNVPIVEIYMTDRNELVWTELRTMLKEGYVKQYPGQDEQLFLNDRFWKHRNTRSFEDFT